jgi:hypothetical protein
MEYTKEELLIKLDELVERAQLESTAFAVLREHLDEISKGLDDAISMVYGWPTQTNRGDN